jgi:hypothetical protein
MLLEHDNEDVVWLHVPLSQCTVARLQRLSLICQAESTAIAASLLHDILMDDAIAHDEVSIAGLLN